MVVVPTTLAIFIFAIIAVAIFTVIGCVTAFVCCCAIPAYQIFKSCFNPSNIAATGNASHYQMISTKEQSMHYREPSAPPLPEDEPIAEAYLVSPLVAAQCVSDVHPYTQSAYNETSFQSPHVHASSGFKDIWAAMLFFLNIVIVSYQAINSTVRDFASKSITGEQPLNANGLEIILGICLGFGCLSAVLGTLWLTVLLRHAARLIEFVMRANIALFLIAAVVCLIDGNIFIFALNCLLAGLSYYYFLSVQSRIPFASAVISAACKGIMQHYSGVMLVSVLMLVLQAGWFILWSAASFSMYQTWQLAEDARHADAGTTDTTSHSHSQASGTESQGGDNELTGPQMGIIFALLVSLYWGAQVLRAIVQTTVAGTVAVWWFQPSRKAAVRGSLFRAVTTSFGSICFGSLLVSLVHAVRDMLSLIKSKCEQREGRDRNFVVSLMFCLADWLLGCVERLLQYMNKYAFCYVAAYGHDFVTSGQMVWALFDRRGWTAIINDNLISNVLIIGTAGVAALNGAMGALIGYLFAAPITQHTGMDNPAVLLGCLGLLLGAAMGVLLLNCIESAVAMIFVCFAEDPSALQRHHPGVYDELMRSWMDMYPEALQWMNRESSGGNYPGLTHNQRDYHKPVHAVPMHSSGVSFV